MSRRPRTKRADDVIRQVQHRRVLDENLADAVAIHVIVLHLLCREGLHPVDQWCLLDDVHGRLEVESPRRRRLEVPEIQIWVGEAVLSARKHTRIHKLVSGNLPLLKHGLQINPVKEQLRELYVDHHRLHTVEEKAWRTEDGLHDTLLHEVRELGARKVRGVQALVALVPEVVKDEVHKVTVDSACGHSKAFLCLTLLALGKVCPG
mmetsp:Transcript_35438/g.101873  ORF Transcript_35438/g.101873 Transcript_35438/m.101873 type:complete len:206 (-) Transcript_35438:358-975(-)